MWQFCASKCVNQHRFKELAWHDDCTQVRLVLKSVRLVVRRAQCLLRAQHLFRRHAIAFRCSSVKYSPSTKSRAKQWKALSDCAKAVYVQKTLELKERLQEKLFSLPAPEKVWQDGWPVWPCGMGGCSYKLLSVGNGGFCDVPLSCSHGGCFDASGAEPPVKRCFTPALLHLPFDHALSHAPNVSLSLRFLGPSSTWWQLRPKRLPLWPYISFGRTIIQLWVLEIVKLFACCRNALRASPDDPPSEARWKEKRKKQES